MGVAETVTGLCGAGGIAGPAAEVTGGRDGADGGDDVTDMGAGISNTVATDDGSL